MAVYGVGAYYNIDVTKDFIENKCFCIGHDKKEASTLYEMLRRAKVGDIVYIKSFSPSKKENLYIKAIGFLVGQTIKPFTFEDGLDMGAGREVKWVKDFSDEFRIVDLDDNIKVNNVYSNTMYEEYSRKIIYQLIEWILE